ncbi:hypothetical protein [Lactobacillus intestinalis]|uniref:hypothetical protein n=1 Tax=Lactobacillus intestinalis TaxID=151781 RepID=UPI0026F19E29|nr:hypothetical protein [Lactobacillus intestinalis]
MSKFTGAYITNTGKEMLFGSKNLTYTKAVLYDQDLSQAPINQVRTLTSFDNPLLTTQIGLADTKNDQVIVEATFKNDRVNQDINFKSVGWYAKTDIQAESLIAVSVIDGIKTIGANAPDQVSTSSINLKLAMAIDDATTVTTQINPAGTITPAQLDSAVSNAKQELNASLKAQADKANSEFTLANNELTEKIDRAIDDTNASLATKAAKTDVDQALSTKANTSDVNAAIEKLKTEYDPKIAEAGKVKGIKVNNSEIINPDPDGLINLFGFSYLRNFPNNQNSLDNLEPGAYTFANLSNVDFRKLNGLPSEGSFKISKNAFLVVFPYDKDTTNLRLQIVANGHPGLYYRVNLLGKWLDWKQLSLADKVFDLSQNLTEIANKLNVTKESSAVAITQPYPTYITDLNELPEGRYNTRNLTEDQWQAIKNIPPIDHFGMIICYREEADGWQLAFSTNHPTTMYFRGAGGATYSAWQKLEQVDVSGLLAKIIDAKNTATQASQKADNANNNANGRLPLSGGNMNLRSVINWNGGGINDKTGNLGGITWNGGTDNAKIYGDQDGNDNLDLAFDLGDDGSNHFSFRKNGQEIAMIGLNGHFTGTVDWDHINGKPSFNNPELESKINNVQNIANSANSKVDTLNSAFAVHKYSNAVNLNDLWSTWGISYLLNSNNTNTPSFISDKRGTLFTFSFDGNGKWQLFAGCISGLAYRSYLNDGNTWHRLVDERDVTSLQNQINDLRNQINQLKSTIPQIRRFNNENDARNWEGNDPNKIAIIE